MRAGSWLAVRAALRVRASKSLRAEGAASTRSSAPGACTSCESVSPSSEKSGARPTSIMRRTAEQLRAHPGQGHLPHRLARRLPGAHRVDGCVAGHRRRVGAERIFSA